MAWIEQRRRADGGLTARVIWRPGGARDATRVWETFGAGSDAQNLARADGFKRMVEAAGQRWPDGWVKGEGFVRPPDVADPMTPPPSFDKIGEEYVRQIVDLSPGQRKRYLGQLQVLARTPVRGSLVFAGPVTAIGEAQLKTWLIEWSPLKRVAAAAGGRWPDAVDAMALRDKEEHAMDREDGLVKEKPAVLLLSHIYELWLENTKFLPTLDLISLLVIKHPTTWDPDGPFGKSLTAHRLGKMLAQGYKIHSRRRQPHRGPRGYFYAFHQTLESDERPALP